MFWNRKPKDKDDEPEDINEDDMPVEQPNIQPKIINTTKKREFLVGHNYDRKTGEYHAFFVTDCFDDAELQAGKRPQVATFPVSTLYDAHEQKQRAEKYCDYMNRINDATQKAYEQTLLIDIMKDNV